MTTEEIRHLKALIESARKREQFSVNLNPRQMDYLTSLIGSHITWREWLVPE
jgi:hypothetical protein